jgi:hypothetical protein
MSNKSQRAYIEFQKKVTAIIKLKTGSLNPKDEETIKKDGTNFHLSLLEDVNFPPGKYNDYFKMLFSK